MCKVEIVFLLLMVLTLNSNSQNIDTNKMSRNKIIGFIYSAKIFSMDWNSYDDEISNTNLCMPLDIVYENDTLENKLNFWNKLFYNELPEHYLMSEDKVSKISDLIDIPKEKFRELYNYWPKYIDEAMYLNFYKLLNLNFVHFKRIDHSYENKFLIKINTKFWDIKTHRSTVLVNILNTYEREFKNFEFFHENYDFAFKYGLIIMDRLCNERPPDSFYYYAEELKKQSSKFIKVPNFGYNYMKYKEEDVRLEYQRVISEFESDLKDMQSKVEEIISKPFEIIKI